MGDGRVLPFQVTTFQANGLENYSLDVSELEMRTTSSAGTPIVLVPILMETPPLVLLLAEASRALGALAPPLNPQGRTRGSAVQSIQPVIRQLHGTAPISFLAGQLNGGVNVVALPLQQDLGYDRALSRAELMQPKDGTKGRLVWTLFASLIGLWIHEPATLAVSKCATFLKLNPDLQPHFQAEQVGARSLRRLSLNWASGVEPKNINVHEALQRCELLHQELRNALDVPASDPDADFLHSWIDRVGSCDVSELLVDESRGSMSIPEIEHDRLRLTPFSSDIQPPVTRAGTDVWHQPLHCYTPTFTEERELYTEDCWHDLQRYLHVLEVDNLNIAWAPEARRRPPPFIRGQECFVPQAQGCIWDLRRSAEGIISPLNVAAPLRSQFHRQRPGRPTGWEYIKQAKPDWPDQRLLWYLERGLLYKTLQ